MQIKNAFKFGVLTLSIILGLQTLAQESVTFSYDQVNEHIRSLRELRRLKVNESTVASGEEFLTALREVENYGQSLAHYILDSYERKEIQPYTLNLLQEYFQTQLAVHASIVNLKSRKLNNEILKALQLESFRKIHDLYFHKKSLRTLISDQFKLPSLGLDKWYSLRDTVLNKRYIEKRERFLKRSAFPVQSSTLSSNPLMKSWANSGLYRALERGKSWEDLADKELFWRNIGDGVLAGFGKITTGASAAFGAVAGNIAWREGYLKENPALLGVLNDTLKPFDLLMEKKAYKFTDITIPGHWGHVGVYMGTEEQLRELGLWDLDVMKPFREPIKNGKRIFQVRRWGLEFDSLENFSNLDEIAVLRVEGFVNNKVRDLEMTIEYLGDQMEKKYDFSFDAMTGETITCTEIIAFSFGPIRWPMEELLGRLTISPNNLAELAFYTGSPLKTLLYITGDEKGLHNKSEADFGKTLNYYKSGDNFVKHTEKCQREMYRHRRDSIRFHYSCEDIYTEMKY